MTHGKSTALVGLIARFESAHHAFCVPMISCKPSRSRSSLADKMASRSFRRLGALTEHLIRSDRVFFEHDRRVGIVQGIERAQRILRTDRQSDARFTAVAEVEVAGVLLQASHLTR
jgi:hypothetical protein